MNDTQMVIAIAKRHYCWDISKEDAEAISDTASYFARHSTQWTAFAREVHDEIKRLQLLG